MTKDDPKKIFSLHLLSRIKWWALAAGLVIVITVCCIFCLRPTPKNSSQDPAASTSAPAATQAFAPFTLYPIRGATVPGGDGTFVKKSWINANPWTEDTQISTLPVFTNTYERPKSSSELDTYTADYESMEALLIDAAEFFGYKSSRFEIKNMTFQVFAELDNMTIYVNDEMTTRIYFDQGVALPTKYNISNDATYEEKQEAAEYLRKKYKKLINMEDLQINVTDGENNNISLFEGAADLADRIVNYNFNRSDFDIDKDGLITSIWIYRPDLSQKLGDYPIISIDEAKELLAAGHFYGGGSWTKNEAGEMVRIFPGMEWVKHVELVYLPSFHYNVHMPYYAFYAGSLYYVPAIDPQYIINMPIYGDFPEIESRPSPATALSRR